MPPRSNVKVKCKKPMRTNTMSEQELMFDSYGHAPLRVKEVMTTVDLTKARFALSDMKFEFHPFPKDPVLAMTMTIAGLVETYLAYGSWHYSKPSIEIESWGLPCNAFLISTRTKKDDETIQASFCMDSKILEISLPHRTVWPKAGLHWLATYKRCCLRHSKTPCPWMGKSCNCEVD